ncbi:ABC transporter permease [archaeon]|jgi:putative ABC transport system permease protein|nr:ABC transporter permease [archaeon]MBT4396641.1 ABC transporter permease [archaeon]MBT4441251.1 ABC transporter permease [archaeon]
MIKDYAKLALRSIVTRKLRSWLTVIGIFIGIATVVALIAVGQGMEKAITEQFEELGTDKIVISAGGDAAGSAFAAGLASNPITYDDLDAVQGVRGVDVAAGMISRLALVEFDDETKTTWVSGFPTDETAKVVEDIQSFEILEGRDIEAGDTYSAVVGYNLYMDDFFEKPVEARDKIFIEGIKFKVVGVVDKIGNAQDDTQIIIPIDTAKEIFDTGDDIYGIMVKIDDGEEPSVVAERIEEELRDFRDEDEGAESFQVQTFEQILEQVGVVLNIISAVLIGIAAISLLVGGVGIMNTMYTAVLERTKEIGIMKSIGGRNSDIMMIFLLESGMYGLVGGGVGVIVGALMSLIVSKVAGVALGIDYFQADITWWLIVGALTFSFVVGVLSGVLPAKQASKMQPVDALRYE